MLETSSISLLYRHVSLCQPYMELFLGSATSLMHAHLCGRSSCATSLRAHGMSRWSLRPAMLLFVAMFLCIFPLMKHLVSSRKDVCQMKHVFSTSNTAFCRISQLSCFFFFMNNPALCVNSKIFLSLLFLFFWPMLIGFQPIWNALQIPYHMGKNSTEVKGYLHQPNYGA